MDLHKLPIRLILSIAAGIAFAMVLSVITHELLYLAGIFPPLNKPMFDTPLVLAELFYHSLFFIAGAMLTAKFAEEKARKAVILLGTKEVIMWILGAILLWKHTPAWYNLTKAILGIPLAMLGGAIYLWWKHKKSQQSPSTLQNSSAGS